MTQRIHTLDELLEAIGELSVQVNDKQVETVEKAHAIVNFLAQLKVASAEKSEKSAILDVLLNGVEELVAQKPFADTVGVIFKKVDEYTLYVYETEEDFSADNAMHVHPYKTLIETFQAARWYLDPGHADMGACTISVIKIVSTDGRVKWEMIERSFKLITEALEMHKKETLND